MLAMVNLTSRRVNTMLRLVCFFLCLAMDASGFDSRRRLQGFLDLPSSSTPSLSAEINNGSSRCNFL
jgi:hypothetical protein